MDIDAYHERLRTALRAEKLSDHGSVNECLARLSNSGNKKRKRPEASGAAVHCAIVSKRLATCSSSLLRDLAQAIGAESVNANDIARKLVE